MLVCSNSRAILDSDPDKDFFLSEEDSDLQWLELEQEEIEEEEVETHKKENITTEPYECLTHEMIISRQQKALQQVKNMFSELPPSSVRALLNAYRWDPVKALDAFTENPEKIGRGLGILPTTTINQEKCAPTTFCGICCDDSDDLTILACGHHFCSDCFKYYLRLKVKEKNSNILCPGYNKNKLKCNLVMEELTILRLLEDKEGEQRYYDSLVQAFVDNNPLVKWCPSAGCKNAVLLHEVSTEKNEVVQCLCGHTFCFHCLLEDHVPISCKMLKDWKNISAGENDKLNDAFISTVTRPCPSCKSPIEKNHGCNHITCSKCRYHFCWQCMQKFGSGLKGGNDGYTSHICNGHYEDDTQVQLKLGEFERFNFYNTRYLNHHYSQEQESLPIYLVQDHLRHHIHIGENYDIHSFFLTAVQQLVKNRRTLKFSYVFGFYRPLDAAYVNKEIFENLQRQMEQRTENLSFLLKELVVAAEGGLAETEEYDLLTLKEAIIHQTRVAAQVQMSLCEASSLWGAITDSSRPPPVYHNTPSASSTPPTPLTSTPSTSLDKSTETPEKAEDKTKVITTEMIADKIEQQIDHLRTIMPKLALVRCENCLDRFYDYEYLMHAPHCMNNSWETLVEKKKFKNPIKLIYDRLTKKKRKF
eukprot:TRINITY_DN2706_c0_g3_i1.p1 TRINITY_DN2706_c0_g3~~TRINITY_DN2706_c0_g3_i1.p1  ORF type:complete len:645 (+),score=95.44 TRINITY_DN2706_c0_g3_i1:143-2077(+)